MDRQERSACLLNLVFEATTPAEARDLLSSVGVFFVPSPEFEKYKQFEEEDTEVYNRLIANPEAKSIGTGDEPVQGYFSTALLSRSDEKSLLRRMNYLKFLAVEEIHAVRNGGRRVLQRVGKIQSLLEEASRIRNHLLEANTRLIFSVAGEEGSAAAVLKFMEAVEKFDYTRGFKLSTLVTTAIKRDAIRQYHKEQKHTSNTQRSDIVLERLSGPDTGFQAEGETRMAQSLVARAFAELEKRDRRRASVIALRFGLDGVGPLTLKEIGSILGVGKERVRQLEAEGLEVLSSLLSGKELPEGL